MMNEKNTIFNIFSFKTLVIYRKNIIFAAKYKEVQTLKN